MCGNKLHYVIATSCGFERVELNCIQSCMYVGS